MIDLPTGTGALARRGAESGGTTVLAGPSWVPDLPDVGVGGNTPEPVTPTRARIGL
ncbi:hypothetical protein Sliba_47530 [Streptomyces nigrescens]|uniref:Uncharacterized protein n=1 Tax=Streptomyces nigrescens TaxID=1920 RepID=A0A640TM89_STRNI|nr:hypothetical protein Sliba_47530 [Streptomyces libani subsp. libani]GGW00458.1 hypothetical protein GCM10010500_53620 [Streptomyces libani subsp. libani]